MTPPSVLTIDDVPSRRFGDKLSLLVARGIPSVLFCWGEKIAGSEDLLVEALGRGFILGNHSWTHRRFSTLAASEAREEVMETEVALARIHAQAGVAWTTKYFRFPYLDRGTPGPQAQSLQELLRKAGYRGLVPGDGADSGCTFDQKEYHYGQAGSPEGLDQEEAILARIRPGFPAPGDRILIHDHENTHEIFFRCIDGYRDLGLEFGLP